MKACLDACVLFPSVVREMLLETARTGVFAPVWSERILGEWQRAAIRRLDQAAGVEAGTAAFWLNQDWPDAMVEIPGDLEDQLWLPDPADVHVFAAAIAGEANVIVTFNLRDFPRGVLAERGIDRVGPDEFLLGISQAKPSLMQNVAATVLARANQMSGQVFDMRGLLKKARLPRLAKVLDGN